MSRAQLLDAMKAAGIDDPGDFEEPSPGELKRFATNGKRHDLAGWIVGHDDGRGFTFGDWRADITATWRAETARRLSLAERDDIRKKADEARARTRAEREAVQARAATTAAERWETAGPGPASHPYLVSKDLPPLVLRAAEGLLLVPVHGPDGAMQSLQTIGPDGTKRFARDGRMAGGWAPVGEPRDGGTLLIGEGWATCAAAHLATQFPALVAFACGNLETVARMARERYPTAALVVLADDDAATEGNPGRTHAEATARALGARVAYPPREGFADGVGVDFADVWKRHAGEPIAAAIAAAQRPRIELPDYLDIRDILSGPLRWRFLVQGLLQEGRVYQIFGPWKAGKSLVAMDLALHLAAGREWAGRKVQHALVVYVAGEAVEDIRARIKGFAQARDLPAEGPLFWLRCRPVYLTDKEHAAQLRAEVETFQRHNPGVPVFLVVDTLARNFGAGRSESNDVDMSDFANNLIDEVVRPTNATAGVVHHSGHGNKDRSRGHSSLPAAVDGTLAVSKSDTIVTLECRESRNTQGGDALHFRLEVAELPDVDNFGDPVTVPVLRYLPEYTPEPPPTEAESKHLRRAAQIVERLAAEQAARLEQQGLRVPLPTLVRLADVRAGFEEANPDAKPDTLSKAWRRLVPTLVGRFGGADPLKVFP